MTLRPSRVVEQQRGISFFVQKASSNCSVCGRPLTAHESVARGIGPVCVRKHMGPGAHPSGSPQSVHAGGRAKQKEQKSLTELSRWGFAKAEPLSAKQSGIEVSHLVEFEDGTKALHKTHAVGDVQSEIMAYEFSESVGWGIVPETVMAVGEKNVTLQRWIEGTTAREYRRRIAKDSRIVLMDILLRNEDRHGGNLLIGTDGRQWAIDNNMAFGTLLDNYGPLPRTGLKVAKKWGGLINAAKDVRRWFKTPTYYDYVAKLEKTHGKVIARQFGLNVADLADWSRKAKVME